MVLKLEIAVSKFLCKVVRNKKFNLSNPIHCFLKKKKERKVISLVYGVRNPRGILPKRTTSEILNEFEGTPRKAAVLIRKEIYFRTRGQMLPSCRSRPNLRNNEFSFNHHKYYNLYYGLPPKFRSWQN